MIQIFNNFNSFIEYISPNLLDKIIYNDDNGYVLFEKYFITKKVNLFLVERNTDGSIFEFSKLKHAATWSILDRYNKIMEAKRVLELDRIISSLAIESQIHKKLQKRGSLESREINRDKYLIDVDKQRHFQWELDKYIILAKTCQEKGYQNELTRTSRK